MDIILFDNNQRQKLYPLNNFCAVADLLAGAFSFRERWEKLTGERVYVFTENYLEKLYPALPTGPALWVDASLIPNPDLFERILELDDDEALVDSNGLVAGKKTFTAQNFNSINVIKNFSTTYTYPSKRVEYPWQLFEYNHEFIAFDFEYIIRRNERHALPSFNTYVGAKDIIVEPSATVRSCSLNATAGPIYIGKNAVVMEGSNIRGPFVLREEAVVKMGSSIYGATSIGANCTIGGEVKNSIVNDYSNKGHHGYLGDSVVGKWCNLGAGTTNSNVKNNAGNIRIWDHSANGYKEIGNKCGMIMGDFSRTAINSSINTGSVIGSCVNAFGNGLLPAYVPDFRWDVASGKIYDLSKAIRDAKAWMKMKGEGLSDELSMVMKHIFEVSR